MSLRSIVPAEAKGMERCPCRRDDGGEQVIGQRHTARGSEGNIGAGAAVDERANDHGAVMGKFREPVNGHN